MYLDLYKYRELQSQIEKQVSLKDALKIENVRLVAGFDVAFFLKTIICAGVLLEFPSLKVVEKTSVLVQEPMPYLPAFLSFREGPPILEAYRKLQQEPDVILVDGNGILHPHKAGVASYVGLSLKKPTIGVAKKLLCGEVKEDGVYYRGDLRAKVLQGKKGSNPLIISPGHAVSFETSLEIVRRCLTYHKLPEPLHLAHHLAEKVKKEEEQKFEAI